MFPSQTSNTVNVILSFSLSTSFVNEEPQVTEQLKNPVLLQNSSNSYCCRAVLGPTVSIRYTVPVQVFTSAFVHFNIAVTFIVTSTMRSPSGNFFVLVLTSRSGVGRFSGFSASLRSAHLHDFGLSVDVVAGVLAMPPGPGVVAGLSTFFSGGLLVVPG